VTVGVSTIVQIADCAESQSGLIATGQLLRLGLTPTDVAGLVAAGYLMDTYYVEDVWRIAGTTERDHEAVHATWLAASEHGRGRGATAPLIAAGETAAVLLDIGDYWPTTFEFVTEDPAPYCGFDGIDVRPMQLDRLDTLLVRGIPAMTPARAITDLVATHGDHSLIARALHDAVWKHYPVGPRDLDPFPAPLAAEHGHGEGDGAALRRALYQLAGMDVDGFPVKGGGTTGAPAFTTDRETEPPAGQSRP